MAASDTLSGGNDDVRGVWKSFQDGTDGQAFAAGFEALDNNESRAGDGRLEELERKWHGGNDLRRGELRAVESASVDMESHR